MLIQFKRGPQSVIQTQFLVAGEPAFATDTRELFVGDGFTIGGVSISSLAGAITYIAQDTEPPAPSNPSTTKAFWYETDTTIFTYGSTPTAQVCGKEFLQAVLRGLLAPPDRRVLRVSKVFKVCRVFVEQLY